MNSFSSLRNPLPNLKIALDDLQAFHPSLRSCLPRHSLLSESEYALDTMPNLDDVVQYQIYKWNYQVLNEMKILRG